MHILIRIYAYNKNNKMNEKIRRDGFRMKFIDMYFDKMKDKGYNQKEAYDHYFMQYINNRVRGKVNNLIV